MLKGAAAESQMLCNICWI